LIQERGLSGKIEHDSAPLLKSVEGDSSEWYFFQQQL